MQASLAGGTWSIRAVRLCRAAEAAAAKAAGAETIRYIIGTEVPVPRGHHEELDELAVTGVEDLNTTTETHRQCFMNADLNATWKRVIAVVVQPGVELGNTEVIDFIPEQAVDLSRAVLKHPRLVFEAHSSDYQTPIAYQQLVADHFAILKVGPTLTSAMREALYALENIVREAPQLKIIELRTTLEWDSKGITINSVSPTIVDTELGRYGQAGEQVERTKALILMRRFAQPSEISSSILFLASEKAAMINGADLLVDGGYTATL